MSTVDATLNLEGELGERELFELGNALVRLAARGCRRVVVDFSEVTHLDFRGIRPLLSKVEHFRDYGGDLKVSGLSNYLRAILRAAGAHSAFECYAHEDEAKQAFVRAPALNS